MSRLPPTPPANQSVYGPEGSPKTSVDISHRVRHQAQRAQELQQSHQEERRDAEVMSVAEQGGIEQLGSRPSGIEPPEAIDDLGGFVPGRRGLMPSTTWMLLAAGAVVAAIVWLVDRQRRDA